ncbi:ARF-binding protein [Candidozyma auris]|uniref:VHS domain-containing protein n=2 Tax=Candidozyma auris TaxID=498019 RepID=A0A2H1A3V0_CANAR|nr:hypothetical_protein [[Candida] auris]PIS57574.1 hypothetical protein CJI97_000618 [[Candida] auris]PIS58128.1 hypothetical protein B9J08_000616 [[Candida] auris]PSK77154.1 hypothetical protein CJJ07_003039 [[Candida] auris]QEL60470.1 hypothetical protein CJJ09_002578 [[Candida] auris]QEO22607.1 hypothetical_protein [[Candida] auris]
MGDFSLSKINPKLLRRIYRACRPTLTEPNLALNLEICDYVNAKQGSTPREAAIAVVKLINQRDPQTAELAIALLDHLVKNCGYPFQLQISRKEFLNELVKKFPERPTLRYSRVQRLILAQIEEWYQTICKTSKYKSDFGYIRDMHRLLANKGYVFPEVNVDDAAVLNPSDTLKTLEDIQKEEAIVHSAKLQELIRRGKPQDLQEANRLMKLMAGFKDNSEENKKKVSDDVARLKRKTEIFAEMLNSVEASGSGITDDNETISDLYGQIKSSHPIVTKIVEEEHDDESYVSELLALNDFINQLLEKYSLLKTGKADQAAQIKVSGGAQGAAAAKELNLIDFDDDEPISGDSTGKDQQGYNDLLSDLSNLNFGGGEASSSTAGGVNPLDFYGAGGSITLGGPSGGSQSISPAPQQPVPQAQPQAQGTSSSAFDFDLLSDLKSPSPELQSNNNNTFNSFKASQVQTSGKQNAKVIIEADGLKVEAERHNDSTPTVFKARLYISNTSDVTRSDLLLALAVPKGCKLDLKPQSGNLIYGHSNRHISQDVTIENPANKTLKVKWKLSYTAASRPHEQTGVSVLTE